MLGHCLFLFLCFNGSDLSDEAVVAARNFEQSIHFHCKYNVLIRTQSHDSEKRKKTLQCLCICAPWDISEPPGSADVIFHENQIDEFELL